MDDSLPFLPPNALKAFTTLYPKERPSWQRRPQTLRLADYEYQTVGIELLAGKLVLRLSQDCPFDEISPAYLAIFVQKLSELCPDVDVAFIPGYGHPIVATLPLEVPPDAPVAVWTSAIEAAIPRLEEALCRQNDAADRLKEDGDFRRAPRWPEVAVTSDELSEIGLLESESVLGRECFDRQEIDQASAELSARLGGLKAIKPDRAWARYLLLDELHSGFWSGVYVESFTADQLVVTLNAVHQGNLYNTDLVNRAFRDRLFARISARARELLSEKRQ